MAFATRSPIVGSLWAEIVATWVFSRRVNTGRESARSAPTAATTPRSRPRFRSIALAPATTLRTPSAKIACARIVAVLVPSPTASPVRSAAWRIICAPRFSAGSLSVISLAMVTPSLQTSGTPKRFSMRTHFDRGPSVTRTASASAFTPRRIFSRASDLNSTCLYAMANLRFCQRSGRSLRAPRAPSSLTSSVSDPGVDRAVPGRWQGEPEIVGGRMPSLDPHRPSPGRDRTAPQDRLEGGEEAILRQDADQPIPFDDRQGANPSLVHETCGGVQIRVRRHRHDGPRHDLGDGGPVQHGRPPSVSPEGRIEHHVPEVAIGDDADEPAPRVDDRQMTRVSCAYQLGGRGDGGVTTDGRHPAVHPGPHAMRARSHLGLLRLHPEVSFRAAPSRRRPRGNGASRLPRWTLVNSHGSDGVAESPTGIAATGGTSTPHSAGAADGARIGGGGGRTVEIHPLVRLSRRSPAWQASCGAVPRRGEHMAKVIVHPTDFSSASRPAFRKAMELAKTTGRQLQIV